MSKLRFVFALALALCAACHRTPAKPHATGRLVFDTKPASEATVFLATEAEVLRSAPIRQRVKEQWQTRDIDAAAIRVSRHPDTMILDVTVTDRDPLAAAETCNRVMQTYIEQRLSAVIMPMRERMQALSEQLAASPDNEELKRKLAELDLQTRTPRLDVRVLEPCTPRK